MNVIFGATGRVGGAAVSTLLALGRPVRALVRGEDAAERLRARGVEVVVGDALDAAAVGRAMSGARGVIIALGGPRKPDTRPAEYLRIELTSDENVVAAARAAGVAHVVYSSGLHTEKNPTAALFRPKVATAAALAAANLPTTVLKPSLFMEALRDDWTQGSTARLAGKLERWVSPIAAQDIGEAAARALVRDDLIGTTIELYGLDRLHLPEAVARWAEEAGRDVKIQRMPLWAFRALAAVLRFNLPVLSLVYPLAEALEQHDWSGDCAPLRELLGREPTSLASWARAQRPAT